MGTHGQRYACGRKNLQLIEKISRRSRASPIHRRKQRTQSQLGGGGGRIYYQRESPSFVDFGGRESGRNSVIALLEARFLFDSNFRFVSTKVIVNYPIWLCAFNPIQRL